MAMINGIREKYKMEGQVTNLCIVFCDLEGSFKCTNGDEKKAIIEFIDKICQIAKKDFCNKIIFSFVTTNPEQDVIIQQEKLEKQLEGRQIDNKYNMKFEFGEQCCEKIEGNGEKRRGKAEMAADTIKNLKGTDNIKQIIYFDDCDTVGAEIIYCNVEEICPNLEEFVFVTSSEQRLEEIDDKMKWIVPTRLEDGNTLGTGGYITSGLNYILGKEPKVLEEREK